MFCMGRGGFLSASEGIDGCAVARGGGREARGPRWSGTIEFPTPRVPRLYGKVCKIFGLCLIILLALPVQAIQAASPENMSPADRERSHASIAIRFTLPDDGEVTLVIEDATGKRIRNLTSQIFFPKGDNVVWWDGTDDLERDATAPSHGVYLIPARPVQPGAYTVRGLWHKPIHLRYQMSIYSPGVPPWPTMDGAGGWMTNHAPASSVLFLPDTATSTGQPLIYIGAYVSEGGSALSWVDLNGGKRGGRGWIGGNWTGAQYLARDGGANPVAGAYAYVGSAWKDKNSPYEIRLTALTPAGDKPVLKPVFTFDYSGLFDSSGSGAASAMGGLAVHDGILVFSLPPLDRLVFVDVKQGRVLSDQAVPNPRGLAFDAEGRLLVLSGTSLLRFRVDDPSQAMPAPDILVRDFDDPRGVTLDSSGNIYISDQGASHQVKMFSPAGRRIQTFGKPGAPRAGPYDPLHMNNPSGVAVDSNGRLWVAENDFQPKRVSVWNHDGSLWKAFYGGPRYGGGGTLDPRDSARFLYDGMEFHIDWNKRDATLDRVFYRPGPDAPPLAAKTTAPETPIAFHGRHYLTDAYHRSPTSAPTLVYLFLDKSDGAVPVAAMGRAADWNLLKSPPFRSRWPEGMDPDSPYGANPAFFIWSDLNGDGRMEPEEVNIMPAVSGGVTVASDGSFLVAHFADTKMPNGAKAAEGKAIRFRPIRFTGEGAPIYDPAEGEDLAPSQAPASDGGGQILLGTDGWTIQTTAPPPFSKDSLGGSKNGIPQWSYPSLWPGLHPSHSAPPPDRPGMLVGTTRLLGDIVTPKGSQGGALFFINGNMGDIYVMTQDGLFVAQLFQDVRQGKLWQLPTEQPDMLLDDVTLHDENFFPSVSQTPDGAIYVSTGGVMALVRVDGLDTIRPIAPMQIKVSASDIALASESAPREEAARQAREQPKILTAAIFKDAPSADHRPATWAGVAWAPIDQRGVAAWFNANTKPYEVSGALAIAGDRLYAIWKTGEPALLRNSGAEPTAPFKTGAALDLMLGTDPNTDPARVTPVAGDVRILVTQVKGAAKALIYRAVVPGTPRDQKVTFSAPEHSVTFDRVDDVSDQVELLSDGAGLYQVSLPLATIGLKPLPDMKIKGDIGILRGDGAETTQRVYWSDKATAIVSDVPSEAALTPNLWGTIQFPAQ